MKIKIGSTKAILENLLELQKQKKKFPVKIKYAIMRNIETIEKEFSGFEKQRIELCKTYADKDEKGKPVIKDGTYDIPDDAKEEFRKELADLSSEEVDADIRMVPIGEFEKCENEPYEMPTWEDLYAMRFMIEG